MSRVIKVGDYIVAKKNSYFKYDTTRKPFIIKNKIYQVINVVMQSNDCFFYIRNENGDDHSFDFNEEVGNDFDEFFQTLSEYRTRKIKSLYED